MRLFFPAEPDQVPDLPPIVEGNLDWRAIDLDLVRNYTIRDWDAETGRLVIDFVVHEGGVAAGWARQARPGQVIGLNTPSGYYSPPSELDWQVLVADAAGMPAAMRLVESTPGVRTRLVLEVPDASHQQPVPQRDDLETIWVHGGNGHAPSRIEEIVRSLPRPDERGYVWVAGETRVLRAVRKYLRRELGLPASAYSIVGYWVEHGEAWRERYDALDDATRASLEALWESDRDPEEIEDDYDAELTRLGL